MRANRFFLALLVLLSPARAAWAQAKSAPKIEPGRVVGVVLGKSVTAGDVGYGEPFDPSGRIDSTNSERAIEQGEISRTFGPPILEQFIAEHIDATQPTADEFAIFRREQRQREQEERQRRDGRLAELQRELAMPGITAEKARALEKERGTLADIIRDERQPLRQLAEDLRQRESAKVWIVGWKIDRELFKAYGGRVVPSDYGPTPLEAKQRLFEEAERKGHLKFNDPGVRTLFYHEFIHPQKMFLPEDAKPFDQPPWAS